MWTVRKPPSNLWGRDTERAEQLETSKQVDEGFHGLEADIRTRLDCSVKKAYLGIRDFGIEQYESTSSRETIVRVRPLVIIINIIDGDLIKSSLNVTREQFIPK